jgi:intergrase/recombinase
MRFNMKRIIILVVSIFITVTGLLYGQPKGERWREMMGPERIEKYKKMRLLEVLNLPEESAVRFNTKFNLHEDKIRELRKLQDELQDRLEENLKLQNESTKNAKEIQKYLDKIDDSRLKMSDEDKRFMREMREFLSSEQMAKFYIFQRNFERELRDAIREMRKGMRRDMPQHRMEEE